MMIDEYTALLLLYCLQYSALSYLQDDKIDDLSYFVNGDLMVQLRLQSTVVIAMAGKCG